MLRAAECGEFTDRSTGSLDRAQSKLQLRLQAFFDFLSATSVTSINFLSAKTIPREEVDC